MDKVPAFCPEVISKIEGRGEVMVDGRMRR
jgi:hypothetical protein